jgi:hypothetical protein
MDKLLAAIERYIAAETPRKASGAKGAITKFVTELASSLGAEKAREKVWETLRGLDVIPEWLERRFTPGSFYMEGSSVWGWWDSGSQQFQAEELPLCWSDCYSVHYRSDATLWERRGFYIAENLPVKLQDMRIEVSFGVERSPFWLQYGYALPCDLQWHRGSFDDGGTCLWVDRSIISAGFWKAWKWWVGCQWWYYEKHPEWFVEMDWWGAYESLSIRYEPENDPYAAVLGGIGKD